MRFSVVGFGRAFAGEAATLGGIDGRAGRADGLAMEAEQKKIPLSRGALGELKKAVAGWA